jgi:GNAT superfamily N-acetyltransferase
MKIYIRKGGRSDLPALLTLIKELAVYENAGEEVTIDLTTLEQDGFGTEHPFFEFLVAEKGGVTIGVALYFSTYSTWKGRVLYLEDLIVSEAYRRLGVGKQLFDALVVEAKRMDAKRLCWQVLDWNTPAIEFYKKINTNFDGEWINCKLTATQIENYQ